MSYSHQALVCALRAAQAEEDTLEALLATPVLEVVLRTGPESCTVTVSESVGRAIVHELLIAAIERRQQAARQERHGRLTERVIPLSAA
ncbi:MAG TPA: hypothetical protein VF598_00325 [Hymenobacter sp.]|jgi:hypothetical protein